MVAYLTVQLVSVACVLAVATLALRRYKEHTGRATQAALAGMAATAALKETAELLPADAVPPAAGVSSNPSPTGSDDARVAAS
jgi:hypothetical protein